MPDAVSVAVGVPAASRFVSIPLAAGPSLLTAGLLVALSVLLRQAVDDSAVTKAIVANAKRSGFFMVMVLG